MMQLQIENALTTSIVKGDLIYRIYVIPSDLPNAFPLRRTLECIYHESIANF